MELIFPLLILALLVPMFLGIRRQKKEMQKTADLQDALKIGDRVMTTSGLHASVAGLADGTVDLEIAPGVVTTWSRMVVREVLTDDDSVEDITLDHIDETPDETQRRLNGE